MSPANGAPVIPEVGTFSTPGIVSLCGSTFHAGLGTFAVGGAGNAGKLGAFKAAPPGCRI